MGKSSIEISKNGRYFIDRNCCPLFWLGDTQWNLFRCHTFEEAKIIIEDRRKKGFTFVQVMLLGFKVETGPIFGEAFPENDPALPNPAYFEHVDSIIKLAQQSGITLAIGLDHPTVRLANLDTARAYGKWIGKRYKECTNIIWVATYLIPEGKNLQVMRELVRGLHEGDEGSHLITCHPDPAYPVATSGIAHSEEWLDFNCIQTFSSVELIYSSIAADYGRNPPKPVVLAEGAYEGGPEYGYPVTAFQIRKQAYLTYLAGGHYSYGHNDNWRVLPTWELSLDAPGSQQMTVLRNIFIVRRWWELIPDQTILESGADTTNTYCIASRTQAGDLLMVYTISPYVFSINMNKITTSATAIASWIDPRNADTIMINTFQAKGICTFSCPTEWEDALLVIESCDDKV